MPGLETINSANDIDAAAMILPFIERAPSLAVCVARRRPFRGPEALADAIEAEIFALDETGQLALLRGHPPLAPDDAAGMTAASRAEQSRLGLTDDADGQRGRFDALNACYAARFDFPFIIALHRHSDLASVLAAFEARISASREAEMATACGEVASVSRARVEATFGRAEAAP